MASAIPTQYQPEENQTNPSSLSARTSVTAARVPAEDRERDEVTSSEGPNLSVQQRLVIKHGCPPHLSQQVVEFIEATNTIDHLGWWITADRNGTLAAQVQAAIAANTAAGGSDPAPSWVCGTCGDTGWVTTETGSALCGDCTNDGKGRCRLHPTLPAHTCGSCRADRHDPHRQYGALDRQGRTSERGNRRILRNSHDNPDRYDIKL